MTEQRVTDMVLKLNRETASGKIQWTPKTGTPSSLLSGEEALGKWYETKIKERWLRLYRLKQRYHFDFEERYEMVDSYRLEFIDGHDQPEWTFPDDAAIADLYETVTRKASGADQFIADFLNE